MPDAGETSSSGPFIDPGQPAPDLALPDQSGQVHRLRDCRGRWVVLYFYPRDNTPGCTRQACAFRDADAELRRYGVAVFGISMDDVASHRRFADQFALPFPLLADEDGQVCRHYGVWQKKSMYGRSFMGIVRTTYLVDPTGRVARRWDKVKPENDPAGVLAALDELAAQPG